LARNPDTSEEGLERLWAAVRANPRSTTFVALVHRLCETGRAPEAEDVCREGLAQHPGLVTGQVALGRVLLDRGRLREAQEVLISAAKANPDHGDAFRWLGETVLKRGDLPRARTLLEYAEELSPNDRRVVELLVEAGGSPTFRAARPRTDFEHTRVANARALADKMHEQPDGLEVTRVGPFSGRGQGGEEPTLVDGAAALKALATVRPEPPEPAAASPPATAIVEASSEQEIVWPSDEEPAPRLTPSRVPIRPISTLGGPELLEGRRAVSALRPQQARGRRIRVAVVAVIVALVAGGVAAVVVGGRRIAGGDGQAAPLRRELSLGTLPSLLQARELERQHLATAPADADHRVALALTDALLARDYGLPYRQEAEEALAAVAEQGPVGRVATAHAVRTLLALGSGNLAEAQRHAETGLGLTPDGAPALLAAARVRAHLGDLAGARAQLERLLARTPDFAPAVLDWAACWIDQGDASAAAQSLRAQLERTPEHVRVRLLLGEAQRALGERAEEPPACQTETRQSPTIRAGCALAAAADARLGGDRAAAVKDARSAAAEAPDDARLLASAALELALLGEIDAAGEALGRAQRLAASAAPALQWADLAVRLGRRLPTPEQPPLASAGGPERRLVAARLALVRGGIAELGATIRALPVALVLLDPDLRALAFLGRDGGGPRSERAEMEKRADHGDPVAAYVLGRLAERGGDGRVAARRLERALVGHGDACDAAARLRGVRPSDSAQATKALRELRSKNAQCDPARM
jgi:tetratricopeptide (TPR) repeat protein